MVTRREFVRSAVAAGAGVAVGCATGPRQAGGGGDGRPNVIVIITDDVGRELLGAYGGETFATPNMDRLAASGMKFNYHFGTPVCTPGRAQMLTGRYGFRSGYIDISERNGAVAALDPKREVTLANLLKEAGYATAVASKWHMGWGNKPTTGPAEFDPAQYRPSTNIAACGFQEQFCFSGPHITYGPPIKDKYHPDVYQNWVLKYLESRKDKPEPFFLYYATGLVHFDFDPTPLNPDAKKNDRANFPKMLEYLDRQIGQLLDKLEELGLRENTLILLSSDNGTDRFRSRFRGREIVGDKGGMKDIGCWVPLLASWPRVIKPGTACDDLTDYTDFLPTICELAGARVPRDRVIDGKSFARRLRGQMDRSKDYVYVQVVNKWFIREKNWKLRENGRIYDVSNSPFEEKKLERADETPEATAARQRLAKALVALVAGEGASQRPAANARSSARATAEKAELEVILPLVSAAGQPVMAEMVVKNRGRRPMTCGATSDGLDLAIRVYDAASERVGEQALLGQQRKTIDGQRRTSQRVDLDKLCGGLKPGTYGVTVECDVEGEELRGRKRLVVQRVAFVVGAS